MWEEIFVRRSDLSTFSKFTFVTVLLNNFGDGTHQTKKIQKLGSSITYSVKNTTSRIRIFVHNFNNIKVNEIFNTLALLCMKYDGKGWKWTVIQSMYNKLHSELWIGTFSVITTNGNHLQHFCYFHHDSNKAKLL